MNYKSKNKNENQTLNKKAMSFINNNFPDYNNITIESQESDRVVALLDYGRSEPKLKVEITKTCDDYNLYRLVDTKLVY